MNPYCRLAAVTHRNSHHLRMRSDVTGGPYVFDTCELCTRINDNMIVAPQAAWQSRNEPHCRRKQQNIAYDK
jgi:hypothetical protein